MNSSPGLAEAMLDRLETYVRHETPTGHPVELDALGELLLERHRELGAHVWREPSDTGDHLVMDHPGTGAKEASQAVLFIGHHDTVWPLDQLDTAMPWRVVDGVAYGPGAYDMKGGLVVLETALQLAGERATEHPPVRVVVVADEEIGSPTSTSLVEQSAADVETVFGFESPHPDGALKVGRRGSTRIRLTARGIEAHAALDPKAGVSAIDELVDQLIRLRSLVSFTPREVLCNVGTIEGGGKTNVVPANASADIGLRFTDEESELAVVAGLMTMQPMRVGAVVSVETLSRRPPWEADPGTWNVLAALSSAARKLDQEIVERPAAGAADTNTTGSMGIPTVDGLGPRGAGAHAVNEQVVVSSLAERAELVAGVLALL